MFDWGRESQMQSYTDVALRSTMQKAHKMKVGAAAFGVAALIVIVLACGGGETSSPGAAEPWTRQFGPGSALSVAVDATGDVYVAGYTVTTLGPGQPWRRDALLRKYKLAGFPTFPKRVAWLCDCNSRLKLSRTQLCREF